MHQAVVCRRLRAAGSASVLEYRKTQCARCRSRRRYVGSRSDRQAAMHEYLSCAISRVPFSETVAVVRVSGCLPGLHPIHLCWFRTGMTDLLFAAVSGNASTPSIRRRDRLRRRCRSTALRPDSSGSMSYRRQRYSRPTLRWAWRFARWRQRRPLFALLPR
jgi:hypothetical protein